MKSIKPSRVIDQAKPQVTGFSTMFDKLEQNVLLGGLSQSTLLNYGPCIAKFSLYFKCPAIECKIR